MSNIIKQIVVLCVFIFTLTACTLPYSPPEFRGPAFVGASDIATSEATTGTKRVRIIMTHGMCSIEHKASGQSEHNWIANGSEIIAQLVGDTSYERQDSYVAEKVYPETVKPPVVARYDLEIKGADGTVYELRMLRWGGPSFEAATNVLDILEADNQQPPIIRAKLNGELKTGLVDNCFVDAIVYSGARGNNLRAAYREAMCDLMGGSILVDDDNNNKGIPGEKVMCLGMGRGSQVPTMLVPESLGSKIMMDAILSIKGEDKVRALGPVRAIHLATNQIPLLSQAEIGTGVEIQSFAGVESFVLDKDSQGATDFKNLIGQLTYQGPNELFSTLEDSNVPLSVVAYSDPNDLLGYLLAPNWVPAGVALTNVLISNGYTYFDYVENPKLAHLGVRARQQIYKMVLYGSDASSE